MSSSNIHIVVIGDIMLDSYIEGSVTRQSPEADVPIILQNNNRHMLGGAANVCLNITSLGAKCSLISAIGMDSTGKRLSDLLAKQTSIITKDILKVDGRITTQKTRIIADGKYIARVDSETTDDLSETDSNLIANKVEELLEKEKIDLLLLQDYDKGVLNNISISKILAVAKKHKLPVSVDPKKKNFRAYQSCSIFKPNLNELASSLKINKESKDYALWISNLQQELNSEITVVTLGENGLLIANQKELYHIHGLQADNIDVCGAGDAVIAALSISYCKNLSLKEMGTFANSIGFLSCLKIGVNPVAIEFYKKNRPSLDCDITSLKE